MRPTRDDPPSRELLAFGIRVRSFRVANGMTQRRLADRLGINQSNVSRLENGQLPGFELYRLIHLLQWMGAVPPPHRDFRQ